MYIIRNGNRAVLIDFGSGDVLEQLESVGINEVVAVLMTHHHRDQEQGLFRANEAGIPIHVPHTERELFDAVDEHWLTRQIKNNYNVRQDWYSLLSSVQVAGTLEDYRTYTFIETTFHVLPTPGHTTGSITILTKLDGQSIAFCGDLIAKPGKVWSLAATQWTYEGAEGVSATLLSLLDLKERHLSLLLPSHGEPMAEANDAIDQLVERLQELLHIRNVSNPIERRFHAGTLQDLRNRPFESLTPHLLRNRTSVADSYILLSARGKALLIDYGYDFFTGFPSGVDRASRRPTLYNIGRLKRDYGVSKIDVVIPTHYHDDHVAGFNLLRDIEGTQVWAPANFSDLLDKPDNYNLPCMWYEPIRTDIGLPLNGKFRWEEYEFTLYELSGHTLYAVTIVFEADGYKVLATGDQQGNDASIHYYVYQNGFRYEDFVKSAELYSRLQPNLIISCHWEPEWVTPDYLVKLEDRGKALERVHYSLLPIEDIDLTAEGFAVRIIPYHVTVTACCKQRFTVEILNPLPYETELDIRVILPDNWLIDRQSIRVRLVGHGKEKFSFHVDIPQGYKGIRNRIAVDLTCGSIRLGQQAEALNTIR